MNLEAFLIALETLFYNKVRTILSMLGIVIGVSTVIVVIGIGIGAQKDIEQQYKNLCVTARIANPINTTGSASRLSYDDVEYVSFTIRGGGKNKHQSRR